MRLLVVSNVYPPHQVGGYELSCHDFVQHVSAAGAEVRVLTAKARSEPEDAGRIWRDLRSYMLPTGEFVAPHPVQRWKAERANLDIFRRHAASLRPDAVMWWNMGGLSLSLIEEARRMRLPAAGVVCDYWMVWARLFDPWHRIGRRWPASRGLAGAATRVPLKVDMSSSARWVFVSEHVRSKTMAEIGALARTDVVHSGIRVSDFPRRAPGAPWKGRLLVVGRLTESKGVDTALRVLSRVPSLHLTVAGGGDPAYAAELRALAAQLSVADRVDWLGSQPQGEIQRLYSRHDALLFPIRWDEPWGKVPLEAMASGLPVVAIARGGSAEYLRDGSNCLAGVSEDDLVQALMRLADDAGLRETLAAGGTATAAANDVARANHLREKALMQTIAESARASRQRRG